MPDPQIAVVTGAGSGIGAAVAHELAARSWTVVLAGRRPDALATVAAQGDGLPGTLDPAPTDVTDEAAVRRLFDQVVVRHGRLDLLFNNAGTGAPPTEFDETPLSAWNTVVAVNLTGVFLMSRAASDLMRRNERRGRIINICSNTIFAGTPNMAAYVAAKGGVFGFTRALATELGKHGITVNAVTPGLTASDGVMASPHAQAFGFVEMLQAIPGQGQPRDIAPAVAFLASDDARWITGQTLNVDGGMVRW